MDKGTAANLVGFITRFEKEQPLYEIKEEVTLMPFKYKEAISDFIQFYYRERLIGPDCYAIIDEFIVNSKNESWFANLDERQVLQCIGVIIIQDRFMDGLINQTIEDQSMIRLLNRIRLLYDL